MTISVAPITTEARRLVYEGTRVFAQVEAAGIHIDVPYVQKAMLEIGKRLGVLVGLMRQDEHGRLWQQVFGSKTSFTAANQIAALVFNELGYLPTKHTKVAQRPSGDADHLESIDLPIVKYYLEMQKLTKLKDTFLANILRETVDGYLHCLFDLHTALSYRSSSSLVNFQNLPIRWPLGGKIVRRAVIPRPGRVFVEVDLKTNEVRVAGCYCRDDRLMRDTLQGDMHRDMAAECFLLPVDRIPKDVRNAVKANFVFAEFYGSSYQNVAANLWADISRYNLANHDGSPLFDHLGDLGIDALGECAFRGDPVPGTFEHHIKKVERRFWDERYIKYRDWRRAWYESYLQTGWFQMQTGFVVQGVYERNQVINLPIQGSAFHCLLWIMIELHKWLRKNKMQTLVVGQIHDSLELDAVPEELDAVLDYVMNLIRVKIRKAWPWLIMPLEAEVEGSDKNWHEKKPIKPAA